MDSEKLINFFEIKKSGHLMIYGTIMFLINLLITFRYY